MRRTEEEKEIAKRRATPEARYGRDVLECLRIILNYREPEKLNAKLGRMRADNLISLTTGTQEVLTQLVRLMMHQGAPTPDICGQFERAMIEAVAFMRDLHGISDNVSDDECWVPNPEAKN